MPFVGLGSGWLRITSSQITTMTSDIVNFLRPHDIHAEIALVTHFRVAGSPTGWSKCGVTQVVSVGGQEDWDISLFNIDNPEVSRTNVTSITFAVIGSDTWFTTARWKIIFIS